MGKVVATWDGKQSFTNQLSSGASISAGNGGPKATELVLAGLVSCSGIAFLFLLERMRLEPPQDLRIEALAERAEEPPRIFTKINLNFHITVPEDISGKYVRALNMTKKYCSVMNMLKQSTEITETYWVNGVVRDK